MMVSLSAPCCRLTSLEVKSIGNQIVALSKDNPARKSMEGDVKSNQTSGRQGTESDKPGRKKKDRTVLVFFNPVRNAV
jgi:hypothetical protein